MSFWGEKVIPNCILAILPIVTNLVKRIRGGFSVDKITFIRFFAFHFILPFFIAVLAVDYLLFFHETESSHPTGIPSCMKKIAFHPSYKVKDLLVALFLLKVLTNSSSSLI